MKENIYKYTSGGLLRSFGIVLIAISILIQVLAHTYKDSGSGFMYFTMGFSFGGGALVFLSFGLEAIKWIESQEWFDRWFER
jgi:hypothetical protein